jgi:hypothetical protein
LYKDQSDQSATVPASVTKNNKKLKLDLGMAKSRLKLAELNRAKTKAKKYLLRKTIFKCGKYT